MAENTALQLLQNGYIFALIEQYNFVKKACNNNYLWIQSGPGISL